MFALQRNAVIGLHLYCGGSPAPPPPPSAGAWPAGCSEALLGCGPGPVPVPLRSPEEELDGFEPEPERGPAAAPPLPGGAPDALRQASLELIGRYLREAAGEAQPGPKKLFPGLRAGPGRPRGADAGLEKALETLRRLGDSVLRKHELAFQGMLRKLEIQKEEDLQAVRDVAARLFSDGLTNWGRVVTLISFGAFVARHLKSIQQEKSIGSLAGIITDALLASSREWMLSQGGWEGFVEFFHVEDLEGSVRNVLMAFAGMAGLGASLAYMIR